MSASKALSKKDMNGLQITNLGAPANGSNDAARKVDVETAYTAAISRANHTGTQTASTVSDFDTQVRTSRLDQMAAPTGPVALNSQKITGLADPSNAQEGATKNYVDTQIAGLVSGQTLKGTVRAVVSGNVNISAPGATLDGLAAAANDVFLLTGQTTGGQNGPWVWNGAAAAMTRPANWDTTAETVLGSYWIVREGTKPDSFAIMSNDTAFTMTAGVASVTPTFTVISVAGATIGRYNADCPAVAAGATWTVTHNLGSTDVIVMVKRVASPFDYIEDVYIATPDANTVSIIPDIALASGEFRVIVRY